MSSPKRTAKWLLVECQTGGNLVFIPSVVNPHNNKLVPGDVLMVESQGKHGPARLIASSDDQDLRDTMLITTERDQQAGPSTEPDKEDEEDYSLSDSSWKPSDDDAESDDCTKVKKTKRKLVQSNRLNFNRKKRKKTITPTHGANPIIQKKLQLSETNATIDRKRTHDITVNQSKIKKSSPDSNRSNNPQNASEVTPQNSSNITPQGTGNQNVTVKMGQLKKIRDAYNLLVNMKGWNNNLETLTESNKSSKEQRIPEPVKFEDTPATNHTPNNQSVEVNIKNGNEEQNENENEKKVPAVGEWIPIGSGKTLIHKDKFKNINWKSYKIATRTMLLAVFERRTLATHSLTGKRSPAFENIPAKMCLDPKIVSDVVIEIMDRFNVKERCIRKVITHKCGDERKMWKTRISRKKAKNNKNMPPPPINNASNEQRIPEPVKAEDTPATNHTSNNQPVEVNVNNENEEQNENEEFNRSGDTVLVSNKSANVKTIPKKVPALGEWVPIGSGKTLIHKDKFEKINFKSYTIATRTMLLAVFKRRILATRSLTGKKSPAFQNNPAKMRLDPNIVSDVIIEIMERFNEDESNVRSVITTKCADEYKMWKTRIKRKKAENNENMAPPSNNNADANNNVISNGKGESTNDAK